MRAIGLLAFSVITLALSAPHTLSLDVPGFNVAQRGSALEESARNKDFEALVRALGEDDQEHQYYIHPLSGGGSPNSRFHMMLRDCRIAKLRAYVQAKPAAEQAAIAEQLFDSAIEAYDAGFKQQISEIKLEKYDPFMSRHDAALAMLLLCSEVCEPESVVQKVDYLKSVIEKHREMQARSPKFRDSFVWGAAERPDSAFLKNLYLYFLEFQFPESAADPDLKLGFTGVGQDYRREVPILYWDLKSNSISKLPALCDTCRLFPEFSGMGQEKTDAQQERRLRTVVDKYVAKAERP